MNPGAQGREQERKPRPFSIPSPLSGGVKAPGLVGVGGHLGCLGGFALDCSGVRPHQGALPRSSEASESTLVTDSSWNGNQGPSYTLSPCDCRVWRDGGGLGRGEEAGLLTLSFSPRELPCSPSPLTGVGGSLRPGQGRLSPLGQPFTDL